MSVMLGVLVSLEPPPMSRTPKRTENLYVLSNRASATGAASKTPRMTARAIGRAMRIILAYPGLVHMNPSGKGLGCLGRRSTDISAENAWQLGHEVGGDQGPPLAPCYRDARRPVDEGGRAGRSDRVHPLWDQRRRDAR